MASGRLALRHDTTQFDVELRDDGTVVVNGTPLMVREAGGVVKVSGGRTADAWAVADGDIRWVFMEGRTYELEVHAPGVQRRPGSHHGSLSAPMPATVRRIAVAPGHRVKRGETLLVLEAMKMELPIRAASDGTIDAVNCREGDLVQPGEPLIEMTEA